VEQITVYVPQYKVKSLLGELMIKGNLVSITTVVLKHLRVYLFLKKIVISSLMKLNVDILHQLPNPIQEWAIPVIFIFNN
jgi:hypothetical protein